MNLSASPQLLEYLSLPSIASTRANQDTAQFLYNFLQGFCDEIGQIGKKNPTVWGKIIGTGNRSVCFYGHYDVQPTAQQKWSTDPFRPVWKNDRLFARGASDNKGQNFLLLLTIQQLLREKRPRKNIIIVLEGEEEIGSIHLKQRLEKHKRLFQADEYFIVDGSTPFKETVGFYYGSRGVVFSSVRISNDQGDLHSGKFSGDVPNTAHFLINSVSELLQNPGANLPSLQGHKGWTVDVSYLRSGGEYKMSIIPGESEMVISFRTPPNLESLQLSGELSKFFNSKRDDFSGKILYTPLVVCNGFGKPNRTWVTYRQLLKQQEIKLFGEILLATLPVGSIIEQVFKKSPLILSFGQDEDGAHAPNESISKGSLELVTKVIPHLL